jgi:methylthioribose-1-phosphate isomerase
MKRHIRFSEQEQALLLLDQRYLPLQEKWFVCRKIEDLIVAMQEMVIRGAPALGVCAAYGCYLGSRQVAGDEYDDDWRSTLDQLLTRLESARPTAVNLCWAVRLMREVYTKDPEVELEGLQWIWLKMAKDLHAEDIRLNKALGEHGAELLPDQARLMTHCNAGALATGGYGTALGVVRSAVSKGKQVRVIANETRPFLQGARLTAYELAWDGIEVQVACDNAAAFLMARGLVDVVVVGADRIAANGDVANKIGTYSLALAAQEHGLPFYVAAPVSTIDGQCAAGSNIPIEERPQDEVCLCAGQQVVPDGVAGINLAFDITPARFIHGIITEQGVLRPPFADSIRQIHV